MLYATQPFGGEQRRSIDMRPPSSITMFVVLSELVVLLGGCGGSNSSQMNNPVPALSSLSPSNAIADGKAFTLTLNGTGFVSASIVEVNGTTPTTTFVNSTQLTVMITPADMQGVLSLSVTVTNPAPGGGVSNALVCAILIPESLKVFPTSPSISVGATQQFTAMVTFRGGNTQDLTASVTWSSSNTASSSINSSGLATAVAVGRPQITATLGSVSGSAPLIVVVGSTATTSRFAYVANSSDGTVS